MEFKMINKLIKELAVAKYGNRSFTTTILKEMKVSNTEQIIAQTMIDSLALTINKRIPATAACKNLTIAVSKVLQLNHNEIKDYGLIKSGMHLMDICAKAGLIKVTLDNGINVIKSISDDLDTYALNARSLEQLIDPREGPQEWSKPHLFNGNNRISIVRKMDRYEMGHKYTKRAMPKVYDSLNRLGSVEYKINTDMLNLVLKDGGFQPEVLPEDAPSWIKKNEIAKSKRTEFDNILYYAREWSGYALNFTYNLDTRGRAYSVQTYLNPQGNDLAKSLLVFNKPSKINLQALMIHIANSFGYDKDSFEGRIRWVEDNMEDLLTIASNPWGNMELIAKFGLYVNEDEQEKKTKYQAIAAILELQRYIQSDDKENFLSDLPIGADSVSSGSQLLSGWSQDDTVSDKVCISRTPDGKVGDLYQYVFDNGVVPQLTNYTPKKAHNNTQLLKDIIKEYGYVGCKTGRKLVKRIVMVNNYSGTRYGAVDILMQDKKDYGSELLAQLTIKEAQELGTLIYKACAISLPGAKKLMDFMEEGVKYHQGGAIMSWTLPDGFTAFIAKDKSKENKVRGTIGDKNVQLIYYTYQNKANKAKMKSAISSCIVHSADSYLMREIVRGMPKDANIAAIHDMFLTTTDYFEDLIDVATDAYYVTLDREVFKSLCTEAFGVEREVPIQGNWSRDELKEATFLIC